MAGPNLGRICGRVRAKATDARAWVRGSKALPPPRRLSFHRRWNYDRKSVGNDSKGNRSGADGLAVHLGIYRFASSGLAARLGCFPGVDAFDLAEFPEPQ